MLFVGVFVRLQKRYIISSLTLTLVVTGIIIVTVMMAATRLCRRAIIHVVACLVLFVMPLRGRAFPSTGDIWQRHTERNGRHELFGNHNVTSNVEILLDMQNRMISSYSSGEENDHQSEIERRMFGAAREERNKRHEANDSPHERSKAIPSSPRVAATVQTDGPFEDFGPPTSLQPSSTLMRQEAIFAKSLRFAKLKARLSSKVEPGQGKNVEVLAGTKPVDSLRHATFADSRQKKSVVKMVERCEALKKQYPGGKLKNYYNTQVSCGYCRLFTKQCMDGMWDTRLKEINDENALLKSKTQAWNQERCYYPSIDVLGKKTGFFFGFLGAEFITGGIKENYWWNLMHQRGKYRAICPIVWKKFIGYEADRDCSEKICTDCLAHAMKCSRIDVNVIKSLSRDQIKKQCATAQQQMNGYHCHAIKGIDQQAGKASTQQVKDIVYSHKAPVCNIVKAWTCSSHMKACPMGGYLSKWVMDHGGNKMRGSISVDQAIKEVTNPDKTIADYKEQKGRIEEVFNRYCMESLEIKLKEGNDCPYPQDKNVGEGGFQDAKSKGLQSDCAGFSPSGAEAKVMGKDPDWKDYTCYVNRLGKERKDKGQQQPIIMGDYERCRSTKALFNFMFRTKQKKLEKDAARLICNVIGAGDFKRKTVQDRILDLFNPWGERPIPGGQQVGCNPDDPLAKSAVKFETFTVDGAAEIHGRRQGAVLSATMTTVHALRCDSVGEEATLTSQVMVGEANAQAKLGLKGVCGSLGVDFIKGQGTIKTKCGHKVMGSAALGASVGLKFSADQECMGGGKKKNWEPPDFALKKGWGSNCAVVGFKFGLGINLGYCLDNPWDRVFAAPEKNAQLQAGCVAYWKHMVGKQASFCSYSFWSDYRI